MRQEHNKLVRDYIPQIIRQSGHQCDIAILSEAEFSQALREKLLEEAQEVAGASPQDLVSELADLQEVIDAILRCTGFRVMMFSQNNDESGLNEVALNNEFDCCGLSCRKVDSVWVG
jgi:predicted house-cleaning noncanonical NTP pyrophosphatase (MazG superfamily)